VIDGICSFESHCGKQIIITNAMKIRAMSDEELAEKYAFKLRFSSCANCDIAKWRDCSKIAIDKNITIHMVCKEVVLKWL